MEESKADRYATTHWIDTTTTHPDEGTSLRLYFARSFTVFTRETPKWL
jgi:hypothetical protein